MLKDEQLAVWFTPQAIVDAFSSIDEEDERLSSEEQRAMARFVRAADEATLREIGEGCISSDSLWRTFHELIELEVRERI